MNQKLILSTLPLMAAACCTSAVAKQQRPNVVFIHADDLGKGMISANGQKYFTTPNIDRIFNQGLKFENAYSSAYSAPARGSLLTGYNDCRNDKFKVIGAGEFCVLDTTLIASFEKVVNDEELPLGKDDLHLAQVFKRGGYNTYAVGKLEWGFLSTRKQMADREWDHYYGYLDHGRCHGFYPPFLFEDGEIKMIEGNTDPHAGVTLNGDSPEATASRWNMEGKAVYCEDLFADKLVEYIQDSKDEPFFLYYPAIEPHGPISIPQIHPELLGVHELTQMEKEFASMVKKLDENVGIILDELEKQGILDNTMIIFTADNGHNVYTASPGRSSGRVEIATGTAFDDYELKYNSERGGDVFNGNGSTSGLKRSNLDGGTNVPFAVYWRGHIEPRVTKELIANYDFLPTMADMLGVKLKVKKSGSSYLPELLDGKGLPKDKYIMTDSQLGGPMIVNNEGWKLRYYFKAKAFELFDLENDPMESTDLKAEHPEIVKDLQAKLEAECAIGYAKGNFTTRNEELYQQAQAAIAKKRASQKPKVKDTSFK